MLIYLINYNDGVRNCSEAGRASWFCFCISSSASVIACGLELMVTLVDEQVHESVVRINHRLDALQVLLLKEFDLASVIMWKPADLHVTLCMELHGVSFRTNLRLDVALVDQLTHKLESFFFVHIETFSLVKFQRFKSFLVLNRVDLEACLLHGLKESSL